MFAQLLINGIIAGSVYALVAAGFSIIYSTNKFVHFAHGVVVIFAGYFLFYFYSILGVNFALSALLATISIAFVGYFINATFYRYLRIRKASPTIMLLASIGILTVLESLIIIFFGADTKTIAFMKNSTSYNLFGAFITPLQIVIVITTLVLFLSLYFFFSRTKTGKAMRAVADNKDVAEIVGISSESIYGWSFIIGSAVAGIGGILIALEQNLSPTMGTDLMVKGFAATIIGGIGSVPGAIIGSLFLGLAENFGIWYLPSGYQDAIAFLVLFIFLILRPQGIISVKKGSIK